MQVLTYIYVDFCNRKLLKYLKGYILQENKKNGTSITLISYNYCFINATLICRLYIYASTHCDGN